MEKKGKHKLPKDLLVEIASIDQVLRVFEFEELKKGTDNFRSNFQKQDKGFCEPWECSIRKLWLLRKWVPTYQ